MTCQCPVVITLYLQLICLCHFSPFLLYPLSFLCKIVETCHKKGFFSNRLRSLNHMSNIWFPPPPVCYLCQNFPLSVRKSKLPKEKVFTPETIPKKYFILFKLPMLLEFIGHGRLCISILVPFCGRFRRPFHVSVLP